LKLKSWAQLRRLKIMFTVSTGVLTSICAIASLVSVRVDPISAVSIFIINNSFRVMPGFAVYSNSVLATLNARQSIRELGEDNDDLTFSFRMRPIFSKTFENVFSPKSRQVKSNIDTNQQYDHGLSRLEDQPDVRASKRLPDINLTEERYLSVSHVEQFLSHGAVYE
ncbi:hypothetical protein H0H93_008960, partial [Arthromyces matolae]